VKYTGESGTPTVGHGLGVAPDMIIIKNLDDTSGKEWNVVAPDIISTTKRLVLDSEAAATTGSGLVSPYINSTIFKLDDGTTRTNDGSSDYIAYCFASIEGYSKVGSYVGNLNADGPFAYCGFRPAYIILKETDGTGDWPINDSKRIGYNVANYDLYAQANNADEDNSRLDILSNGFKLRSTFGNTNANGQTMIFLAFAESPFKYSNAR